MCIKESRVCIVLVSQAKIDAKTIRSLDFGDIDEVFEGAPVVVDTGARVAAHQPVGLVPGHLPDVSQEVLDASRLEPDVVLARAELLAHDARRGTLPDARHRRSRAFLDVFNVRNT